VLLDDEVFDPAVLLDTISREGVTGLFMPGPLLTPVLDTIESRGRFEHRLRRMVVFFGTPELLQRTTELMGPIWAHGFGATEQGAVTTRLLPVEVDERAERIHSVGRSGSPFLEVAVVDDHGRQLPPNQTGEIVVRSAMSIGEYWAMPGKTAEAFLPGGWFRSMDVGHLDEDGFLYFSDRATEKISIADEVVFPHLVEGAVLRHPAVANCGVVGLGETGAQQVVAAVRLKPEVAPSSGVADEILARTADLPATHRPTRVIFVDDLPTVFGGAKVQRHALREQLASIT
jgi:acyl-coenzyme A synthetase/AMP-(fatty) acid ligase